MTFLNKIYVLFLGSAILLFAIEANSQPFVELQPVEITFNKTSSIVFPASITSVDRGSRDVLVQKAKGVNNVLQLKAGRINFNETNLTVITADGKLHHFLVQYADHPKVFTVSLHATSPSNTIDTPLLFQTEVTTAAMNVIAENILMLPKRLPIKRTAHYGMRVFLKGIYIQDNVMYYHLTIANNSNIPFHTEMLSLYTRDKQKVKRTATQEVAEVPLYVYGNTGEVKGKASQDVVIALSEFTIPEAKLLVIELMEKKGGRHLALNVRNRTIVKARPAPTE